MPATTVLNGLFNVLTHVTWDVDAQCPAAVSSSLTADQPIHPVGTICAQIARYSLRQPTGMEHALTVQMTKHESTTESKSEVHPSNWNQNYFRQSAFTRVLARLSSGGYAFRYPPQGWPFGPLNAKTLSAFLDPSKKKWVWLMKWDSCIENQALRPKLLAHTSVSLQN